MDPKSEIRRFLAAEVRPGLRLSDEESLWESGVLDSLAILQLVYFIEFRFGMKILDKDITVSNFNSISSVARYVTSRTKPKRPAAGGHGAA